MNTWLIRFIVIIIFFVMYIFLYILTKRKVTSKLKMVNKGLAEITAGNLDTVIDVQSGREFVNLSEDVNETVAKLKSLIAQEAARIDRELETARAIQESALPTVEGPFVSDPAYDIYAVMHAAKEVGGDFYDFFYVGRSFVFVIADVSGKGIPAALFMMKAKAVIKSAAEEGLHVEEILYRANNTLSEGNKADMFVTCWIGKIDLDTGHLECTSAGHNPALVAGKGQEFSYQKIKVGFVLGGMEEMKYKRTEYDMQPGDTIFLYTDGVTEAHNKDEKMFGDDRLLEVINRYQDEEPEGICEGVLKELGEYIGEADQFDDITMVCFRYHPPKEEAENAETEKPD